MKKSTTAFGAGLFSILVSGTLAGNALAERRAGIDFAVLPANPPCLQIWGGGTGGLKNNCAVPHLVVATHPSLPAGVHQTHVYLFGSVNSWCQSTTINPQGTGADVGAFIFALGGGQNWQSINTGNRNVGALQPIVFRCTLEPGGIIGTYTVQ